jgi:hypothetical protein
MRRPRGALLQNDDRRRPSTAPAELPLAVLEALTFHPFGLSTVAYDTKAAFVGISMGIIDEEVLEGEPGAIASATPPEVSMPITVAMSTIRCARRFRRVKLPGMVTNPFVTEIERGP